jgi:hypothetical protein
MAKKPAEDVVVDPDDLDKEALDERVRLTLEHIEAIKRLWPGLVRLSEEERGSSLGRSFSQFKGPLRALFTLLAPKDGKDSALLKVFHVLGDEDRGDDSERFEPELLLRRMARVEAEQRIADELATFGRLVGDDVLNTAEMVLGPGLLALELSRTVAKANAEHRSALTPVLDTLRSMTKKARKRRAEKGAAPAGGTQGGQGAP